MDNDSSPLSNTSPPPSEEACLARIRYPDREAALFCGTRNRERRRRASPSLDPTLVVGMTSVTRERHADAGANADPVAYVHDTVTMLFNRSRKDDQDNMVVVVALMDLDRRAAEKVARQLCTKFRLRVDSARLLVVIPPDNIYPPALREALESQNGSADDEQSSLVAGHHPPPLTHHISKGVLAWRSKLVLDYAFLFSYSTGIAEYFINLGKHEYFRAN